MSALGAAGCSYQRQIQRALVDFATVDDYSQDGEAEERRRKKPHRYKPGKALLKKLKAARKRAMKKLYLQQQQGQLSPVPPSSDGGTANPASTDNPKQIKPVRATGGQGESLTRALGVGPQGQGGGYVTPFSYGTSNKKQAKKQSAPKPRQAKVTNVKPKKGKRY